MRTLSPILTAWIAATSFLAGVTMTMAFVQIAPSLLGLSLLGILGLQLREDD